MTSFEIIKNLCEKEGISISTLEKEMGYGNASLSKAKKIPAERIQELAKRFGCSMEYLMTGEEPEYYINPETAAIAQEIFENKELRLLFDAAHDSEPEDLEAVHGMLLALKRKERGYDD